MPAKYLLALGEERRPDLHRQIGCVTGILQAFDRRYPIAAQHSHKRLLPPGNALSSSPSVGEERTRYGPQIVLDKNFSRSWIENQRASSTMETSSSSCSSFSSLDGNRSTQQDLSSTDRMLFPEKPFKCSPRLKSSPESDNGPDYFLDDTLTNTPSAQSSHRTLGIRNLVKDSIYRDTRDLSARTSTTEAVADHTYNRGDAATCFDESPSSDIQAKSKGTMDINESLRVLAKLRESSWSPSEPGHQPRLSYDAPRFSYDGRESASKRREMPRLSLDIKEGPLRTREMDSWPKPNMNDTERSISFSSDKEYNAEIQKEQPAASKRLPSVVAKLMGLEELPEPNDNKVTSPQAPISVQERKQEHILIPLSLSSHNEPARRQNRNLDATIRNVPNSKFPAETAPWKQERIVLPRKLPKGSKAAHGKEQPAASVYSEIEKRLNDLDFQHSNKDLRALKQILDSMQAKGLLQNKKREEASMLKLYDDDYNSQEVTADANPRLSCNTNSSQISERAPSPSMEEESIAEKFFKSPIVIMKPANSADFLGDTDSPVVPLRGLSDLPQLRTVNSTDKRKMPKISRATVEQRLKSSPTVPASQPLASDGRPNGRNEVTSRKQKSSSQLMTESSSRRQQLPRDNNGMLKHKNSTSPRLPQKKLDMERRSRLPIPSPESNKNQRQSADKSHLDTISPRSKVRRKLAQGEDGHQNVAKSRTRSLNQQGDDMSLRSDGSMSVVSELDIEVTSADRSAEVDASSFQQGNQTPPGRNPQKVKTSYDANKDLSSMDHAATIPERPSPVSVLDSSFDQENIFHTSKTSNSPNVDDQRHPSDVKPTKLTTQSENNKLANVASLLQKLQQLTVTKDDDEAPPVDHIAFLCETQIPDHRYVSEILLASGLLMKDLGTGLSQIQLHASGYPINPDLFLVLEQRKSGWTSKPEGVPQSRRSDDPKRAHRKLMFDAVNMLLLDMFEKETSVHAASSLTGAREVSSGQQLVKAICSEIEYLKAERSRMCQEKSSTVIPDAEILHRLEGWTTSFVQQQLPGMILEIERSIFKELVDEVVRGEAADGPRARAGRRGRRRLFA
ncbi:protein LONGIFOLIA 1 [Hordeum vulgare]|uniref:DUF4378 domain-containing protein n=1 Tax=Hordeum vulgare subsp. vulgare TaxID=112509 RepID=A0A287I7H1_HORVV|nr:protein LONGIFOLIA 1-like [Hordeum vulgare subsp. vulgare]KAE8819062.1 protein LONGIFOLIA 1 [Hordeum vulgare]